MLEPGFAPARHKLAIAYLQTGNVLQAKGELTKATARDPGLLEAAVLLAELDLQARAIQAAPEILAQEVARRPSDTATNALRGLAHLGQRQPCGAPDESRTVP